VWLIAGATGISDMTAATEDSSEALVSLSTAYRVVLLPASTVHAAAQVLLALHGLLRATLYDRVSGVYADLVPCVQEGK
jgi:hypothetical protein